MADTQANEHPEPGTLSEYYERHMRTDGYYVLCDCYWCTAKKQDENRRHEAVCKRKETANCTHHDLPMCHCDCRWVQASAG